MDWFADRERSQGLEKNAADGDVMAQARDGSLVGDDRDADDTRNAWRNAALAIELLTSLIRHPATGVNPVLPIDIDQQDSNDDDSEDENLRLGHSHVLAW